MKTRAIISIIMGMILVLVMVASGCAAQQATQILEDAVGLEASEDVEVTVDQGEVTVTSEQGDVQTLSGDLSEDWPAVVPVHADIEVDSVLRADQDGKLGWSVMGTLEGSAQNIYEYYKQALSDWNVVMDDVKERDTGEKEYNFRASNGTYLVILWMMDTGSGTNITLGVEEE